MRYLPILALTLMFAACSCVVSFGVSGSIQRGIAIEATRDSSAFTSHAVFYKLSIREDGCDETEPLWAISGKSKGKSIAYGKVPSGMSEIAPAKPLEPGKKYVVTLLADTGVTCNGQLIVTINALGEVEASTRIGSACG